MSSTAIFAPDGSVRMIPQAQMNAALSSGGESAVQMKDPSGNLRYVRQSQVNAAQQAGGTLVDDNPDWTPQAAIARSQQEAQQVSRQPINQAMQDPSYVMATGGPKDPGDVVLKSGTTAQKIHRAVQNTFENLAPTAAPAAVASTLPFLAGLAGGTAGSIGARKLAQTAGASEDWSDVAGDTGALLGGVAGTKMPGAVSGFQDALDNAGGLNNLVAQTAREPFTGKLKPGVPRLPFFKWATEMVVPKGDEGSITNPVVVPKGGEGSVEDGQYYRVSPVRLASGQQGVGTPGTPQQESGYYPAVTKVPIRPTPNYNLTPEQVPGPDTSGKGNLLSPLAKKGDPRAAAELMRRGRNVLYVPAENYPDQGDFTDLQSRIQQANGPTDAGTKPGQIATMPNGDRYTWSGSRWIWTRNDGAQ